MLCHSWTEGLTHAAGDMFVGVYEKSKVNTLNLILDQELLLPLTILTAKFALNQWNTKLYILQYPVTFSNEKILIIGRTLLKS